MNVDLLYVTHNRLEFTQASFKALLDHTDWDHIDRVWLIDDRSVDGTLEFVHDAARLIPRRTSFTSGRFGGPVAVMNHTLDRSSADVLAKIDNDVIVCPGWLNEMTAVLEEHPRFDALGMEPGFGDRYDGQPAQRRARPARWIGGVGLIRTRVFKGNRRPQPNERWFGWTQFQRRHVNAAWITPDLPVFLLDHLPVEPWRSLTDMYATNGWTRRWETYADEMTVYYDWWVKEQASLAV